MNRRNILILTLAMILIPTLIVFIISRWEPSLLPSDSENGLLLLATLLSGTIIFAAATKDVIELAEKLLFWISGKQNIPPIETINHDNGVYYRARTVLLNKVRAIWVHGLLDNSLHEVARIELGLEYSPTEVKRPWPMTLTINEQHEGLISSTLSIGKVFDEMGGYLLILGDPGAGKTTTLLELARDLLDKADADIFQPIPLVLNLSSWAQKRQKLGSWLVEELDSMYQVNAKFTEDWLTIEPFCLLLDGLDEVDEVNRDACVNAINDFQTNIWYDANCCK